MSYQVLSRKWRPQQFQDVIGQSHITSSLQNALKRGALGHAYLLTGTRGIGKTTIARLFARALRCQNLSEEGNPCQKCDSCLDAQTGTSMNIIEIDGASNNGVDSIRELISNVQYPPTIGRYKVYIIDEVHMLSTNAFNALLKTLEEPPEHIIFILATTEPLKLLGTVLSRCIRFDLRNVSINELATHLKRIAQVEGIRFANERLIQQLCRQGKGSVRDTLSLLDQVLSFAKDQFVGEEELVTSLGLARGSAIRDICSYMLGGDAAAVSVAYHSLIQENTSPQNMALSLIDHLYDIIKYIDSPAQLRAHDLVNPELLADITTAEIFWIFETISKEAVWVLESLEPERTFEILLQKISLRREFFATAQQEAPKKKVIEPIVDQPKPPKRDWHGFIQFVAEQSSPTASNLEQGNLVRSITHEAGRLQIELGFAHDNQVFFDHLNDTENRKKIEELLSQYFEVEAAYITFKLTLVENKEDSGFVSVAEEKTIDEMKRYKEREQQFINQPIFEEARRIFNSDFDKVILNKK